ncbi:hypothetical protein Dimus_010635 [Dionaea muscipula]
MLDLAWSKVLSPILESSMPGSVSCSSMNWGVPKLADRGDGGLVAGESKQLSLDLVSFDLPSWVDDSLVDVLVVQESPVMVDLGEVGVELAAEKGGAIDAVVPDQQVGDGSPGAAVMLGLGRRWLPGWCRWVLHRWR